MKRLVLFVIVGVPSIGFAQEISDSMEYRLESGFGLEMERSFSGWRVGLGAEFPAESLLIQFITFGIEAKGYDVKYEGDVYTLPFIALYGEYGAKVVSRDGQMLMAYTLFSIRRRKCGVYYQ